MGPTNQAAADARARLVEALLATGRDDREAFARVYRLTAAKLFGICLRICGERQAAEDVLQDVYLTVWRRAAGYDPGRASPITWLATIARNRAIDWARAHARAPAGDPTALADLPEPRATAPEQLLLDEEERRLHGCLDALDGPGRDAIRRAFFDGLTYAELAGALAVPLPTMKSWIRRSLLRLRECLHDDA